MAGADGGNVVVGQLTHGNVSRAVWNALSVEIKVQVVGVPPLAVVGQVALVSGDDVQKESGVSGCLGMGTPDVIQSVVEAGHVRDVPAILGVDEGGAALNYLASLPIGPVKEYLFIFRSKQSRTLMTVATDEKVGGVAFIRGEENDAPGEIVMY